MLGEGPVQWSHLAPLSTEVWALSPSAFTILLISVDSTGVTHPLALPYLIPHILSWQLYLSNTSVTQTPWGGVKVPYFEWGIDYKVYS